MISPKDETNNDDHEMGNDKKQSRFLRPSISRFRGSSIDVILPQRFELMRSRRSLCEISLSDDSEADEEDETPKHYDEHLTKHKDQSILCILDETLGTFEDDIEEPSRPKSVEKMNIHQPEFQGSKADSFCLLLSFTFAAAGAFAIVFAISQAFSQFSI
mmetsp:Transcript_20767/g.31279  ORF Transcript_20767/g.31279 Transcript_20767/m.31279 type:complete len:159 (+) Transcript_20767:199-675(+)